MNIMDKFQGFANWLKANRYVSWTEYISFMKTIDNTLMTKGCEKIMSGSILQQLFIQLQSTKSFMLRGKSDRDNIFQTFAPM